MKRKVDYMKKLYDRIQIKDRTKTREGLPTFYAMERRLQKIVSQSLDEEEVETSN